MGAKTALQDEKETFKVWDLVRPVLEIWRYMPTKSDAGLSGTWPDVLDKPSKPLESLSGEPDYFGRKKISSGGDLSHYSSASLY